MKAVIFVVINTFYQATQVGGFPVTKIRYISNDIDRAREFYDKIDDQSDLDRALIHLDKVFVAIPMNKDTEGDDFEEEVLEFHDFNRTPKIINHLDEQLSLAPPIKPDNEYKIEISQEKQLSIDIKQQLSKISILDIDGETFL
jgi:hypothetical protein